MIFRISVACAFLLISLIAYGQTIEQKAFVPPLKTGESRYFYIPFDVPANTKSLTISYSFDEKKGLNSLDLGVFDSRFDASENSLAGFRGWTGRRRNTIFISENSASNGYTSGKIPAGKWRVILGRYKVAPEGVEVTVNVKFNDVDAKLINEPETEENQPFTLPTLKKLPSPENFGGYTWFRGDLHMHTYHSDGKWTYPIIFAWANAAGLDFVGLPDHNTTSHHREIDKLAPKVKNLLILRGEEVTTYGGHFNVWGLPSGELIDFRITPKDTAKMQKSVNAVHKFGLIASINHPTLTCGGCDWSYGDWRRLDAVEIWNGVWSEANEKAVKLWDEQLQKGLKISVIGSSDTHNPPIGNPPPANGRPIGQPTTHAGMKALSQKELLAAIKHGRVWISDESFDYKLSFSAQNGKTR